MTTPAVIDALWAQIEPIVFITHQQFARGLDAWEIEAVDVDGELAFAVLTRGPEIHFASFGGRTPISRAMIAARIDPLMERYGFVTTRTPKDEGRQHRINRLLGFEAIGADEFFTHFRRDKKCL
jgi:hypothetical protein